MFSTFKKFKTKLLVINREYSTSLITKRQIYIMKTILEKKTQNLNVLRGNV